MTQTAISGWSKTKAYGNDRVLRYAALVYLAAWGVHTADHVRRGTDALTEHLFWLGTANSVVQVSVIALALFGHRLAPLAAVVTAFPAAIGIAAAHGLPRWSVFSDAFPGGGVDAWSWTAVLFEIFAALAFGSAGAYVLRKRTAQV
jgi:hypothetical protein